MLSNLIEVGTLVEVRFDRGDRIPNIGAKRYDGTRHVVSVKKSYGPAGSLFELDGAVSDKGVPYTIIVVVLEYAIISIGKEADRQANEMYEKWKEEHENERIHTKG